MSVKLDQMSPQDALARAEAWAVNPGLRPSPEDSRAVAASLAAEVKRLQGVVLRAQQESELIERNGKPALAVPYWFIKS